MLLLCGVNEEKAHTETSVSLWSGWVLAGEESPIFGGAVREGDASFFVGGVAYRVGGVGGFYELVQSGQAIQEDGTVFVSFHGDGVLAFRDDGCRNHLVRFLSHLVWFLLFWFG